ncbi:MAG: cytidine deaminase [Bacilli bacterium]
MKPEILIQHAIDATKDCHVPYSRFKVGAAILMKDGTVVTGANIENSSYGLSMCAERTALYHAHLRGYRKQDMLSMAVIGPTSGPISPCGACRQVMHELMDPKTPIILSNLKKELMNVTPETLLPYAFTSKDLK